MKKYICLSFLAFLASGSAALACEVCGIGSKQPKFLREMTHGTTPNGNIDFIIVGVTIVLVLFTLAFSIKFLIRPGERNTNHIKRTILNLEPRGH